STADPSRSLLDHAAAVRGPIEPTVAVETAGVASRRLSAAGIVYGLTAVYAAVFLAAAVLEDLAFRTARLDVGNAVQAIWSTTHGHLLETTDIQGAQIVRFGSHVDP